MNNIKGSIEKGFEELVKKGKIPEKFLRTLKVVIKAKNDYLKKKISKQEVEKIRREANIFIRTMIDIVQRKKGLDLERAKLKIKYENDKIGEIIILDNNVFIIKDINAPDKEIIKGIVSDNSLFGEFKKSNLTEFEEYLKKTKIVKKISITENTLKDLKTVFGDKIEILVN